ncbi:hypothetical protein BD408DRAFT_434672 [Parasitella parasitica]|nr:hypothetical protein BD408DRAFT_434672 [Parasitella parasitica]
MSEAVASLRFFSSAYFLMVMMIHSLFFPYVIYGGLGIIDIYAQQKALYYRWLDPVLFDRPYPPAIPNYVCVHIQNQLETEVLDIGLLFPAARSTTPFGALSQAEGPKDQRHF